MKRGAPGSAVGGGPADGAITASALVDDGHAVAAVSLHRLDDQAVARCLVGDGVAGGYQVGRFDLLTLPVRVTGTAGTKGVETVLMGVGAAVPPTVP